MNEQDIRINHLPCLTWNRLGVNHRSVPVKSGLEGAAKRMESGLDQEGIASETVTVSEAEAYADSLAHGIRGEKYVAGKTAIYMTQAFQTGLGGEFTDYINTVAGDADIYRVAANARPARPVILNYDFGAGADDAAVHVIVAGENSESTFLINYRSDKDASGFSAVGTKVILGKGAKLTLIKVNLLGEGFEQLDDTGAGAEENAVFCFRQMELGGAKTYSGCYVDQNGQKSEACIDSGYMVSEDHTLDLNYVTAQRGKKTVSNFNFKGVLQDRARKTLRDTIDFRNGSAGSVGDEQEDVLLLDPTVVNKSVPVILCEEEDVDGRHGASIGRLSEDMLYYLETRGLSEKEATVMMVRGRLHSIAREIPDDETQSAIDAFISGQFGMD